MNITTSRSRAKVIEVRYVWAPTIAEAMELAQNMSFRGWKIQGNPAPMVWNDQYGTGVTIMRITADE